MVGHVRAFAQVATATGSYHVFPACAPALAAWNNMVKCQFLRGVALPAILAGKIVPQKNIESRKRRFARCGYIVLEGNHTGQAECLIGGVDFHVIFTQDRNPVEADSLYGILPPP